MARVNITVPDDLLGRARVEGLNVSRICAAALAQELDRRSKISALDRYLRELDVERGPVSADEEVAAREWVDHMLADSARPVPVDAPVAG